MKKIQARAINDRSWIVTEWGNRVGVLSCSQDRWTFLEKGSIQRFDSLASLQSHLDWQLEFEQTEDREEPVDRIQHLPTRHPNPQNIQLEPYISYTRTTNSSLRFAAGYWGIRFAHGWVPGFCPKLETITSYEHLGPFSTKLEMNTVIRQKGFRGGPKA